MSEELLILYCAPTLAGIKTGNLFSMEMRDGKELLEEIRRLNGILVPRGLRMLPIGQKGDRKLIYVYRPARLQRDLSDSKASTLLRDRGYPCGKPEQCVVHLVKNLRENTEFPHEIGLFLGYPPEDVQGFIENRAEHCKCVGCWKVYGNVEEAKQRFRQYEKCTQVYYTQWRKGYSIERLAVTA